MAMDRCAAVSRLSDKAPPTKLHSRTGRASYSGCCPLALEGRVADPFHGNVMRTASRPMCLERNHAPLAVRAAGREPLDMHRASMSSATPVRAPRGRPCALFWLLSLVAFPRWVLNAECAVAPGRDFDPRNDGRERCRCRSDSHNSVLLRSGSWRGAGQPKGA